MDSSKRRSRPKSSDDALLQTSRLYSEETSHKSRKDRQAKGRKGNSAKTGCESPGTFANCRHCFRFHPDVIPAFAKSKIRNEGLRRRGSVCHPKVRGTTIHLR